MNSMSPHPLLRYAFYAFVFTVPIEAIDIGISQGVLSLSSLTGYVLIGAALLQPRVCFRKPPAPFWYFVGYLFLFICLGILQDHAYGTLIVKRVVTLVQMLALFWISYSLFHHQRLVKESLLALGAGCVLLSLLLVGGSGAEKIAQGRVTTMSMDANGLGSVLSLGLLSMLGLAYGRISKDGRINFLAWLCFGILAVGVVLTGSRGAFLSLMAGILALTARPGQAVMRMKIGFVALVAGGCLVLGSYASDSVRARWERTFSKGSMSGREKIMPVAWQMFTEAPILGWGPERVPFELGRRFQDDALDTHNAYLWILTETGIVGGIPFFIGLALSWRAGWRARAGTEGSLPLALLSCIFVVNMSLTWHYRKLFWIVLAYSTASALFVPKRLQKFRSPDVSQTSETLLGYNLQHW